PDVAVDPARLEQGAALAADRADVAEELQRLQGHLDQFEGILRAADGSVGKKLDFLTQEILRELNTLGSKSRDLASTREVLEMKAETEKIPEQVQKVAWPAPRRGSSSSGPRRLEGGSRSLSPRAAA